MNTQITITISEHDGKLNISAGIPDGAENTVAAALAELLLSHAQTDMNKLLGVEQQVTQVASH